MEASTALLDRRWTASDPEDTYPLYSRLRRSSPSRPRKLDRVCGTVRVRLSDVLAANNGPLAGRIGGVQALAVVRATLASSRGNVGLLYRTSTGTPECEPISQTQFQPELRLGAARIRAMPHGLAGRRQDPLDKRPRNHLEASSPPSRICPFSRLDRAAAPISGRSACVQLERTFELRDGAIALPDGGKSRAR